jgi:hypothetical protein
MGGLAGGPVIGPCGHYGNNGYEGHQQHYGDEKDDRNAYDHAAKRWKGAHDLDSPE